MASADQHFDVRDDVLYQVGFEIGLAKAPARVEAETVLAIAARLLESDESDEKVMLFTRLTREQVESLKK